MAGSTALVHLTLCAGMLHSNPTLDEPQRNANSGIAFTRYMGMPALNKTKISSFWGVGVGGGGGYAVAANRYLAYHFTVVKIKWNVLVHFI